jgi:hypothetical protein
VDLVEFVLLAGCGLEEKIVFLRRADFLQVTSMRAALRLNGELYSV